MLMLQPHWELYNVEGIGKTREKILNGAGITNILQLCKIFPKSYVSPDPYPISLDSCGEPHVFSLNVISSPRSYYGKKSRRAVKFFAEDDFGGKVTVFYFNQPYIKNTVKVGDRLDLYCELKERGGEFFIFSPTSVRREDFEDHLMPIYSPIGKISGKVLETLINNAIYALAYSLEENLPPRIVFKYGLPHPSRAIVLIHRPTCEEDIRLTRLRYAIEEVFEYGIKIAEFRRANAAFLTPGLSDADFSDFEKRLPYRLTDAQKKAITEIKKDMIGKGDIPSMNRLLQGDVGCGKTSVAAAAIYLCVKNKRSAVLMAPTEILSKQHYETLSRIFSPPEAEVLLLNSSTPAAEKRRIKKTVNNPDSVYVLIGTHAVITGNEYYRNVALTITDEQQRFGTIQRNSLNALSGDCHSLVMTATPIPRSLAMFLSTGDAITTIDTMPPGRLPVKTVYVSDAKLPRIYRFIEEKIKAGQKAYIVCPLIEKSDEFTGMISAEEEYEECKKIFGEDKCAFIHGKMKNADKDAVMNDFRFGEKMILVSTTVIEVGVDVPSAGIMVVINAERLGLSQIHQLRGRIGRGGTGGLCVLVSSSSSKSARSRLNYLCNNSDGFKIAEYDLKTRGPGQIFGYEQSGFFALPFPKDLNESLISFILSEAEEIYDIRHLSAETKFHTVKMN